MPGAALLKVTRSAGYHWLVMSPCAVPSARAWRHRRRRFLIRIEGW